VDNQCARAVRPEGNRQSQQLIDDVFEVCDRKWRGVGLIPKSGSKLRYEYRVHDAERLFEVDAVETQESSLCISGQILKGLKKPHDCPAFGKQCTAQTPLGATMVSSEGACATYPPTAPPRDSSGPPLGLLVAGLVVVGLGVMAWTYLGPDLRRYIKMSNM
jgi:hydrogenase expression/formation protein HypD